MKNEPSEKKEIPMKVVPVKNLNPAYVGVCRVCLHDLIRDRHPRYCGSCGQRLEWPEQDHPSLRAWNHWEA
jgi:hypothetical protein